MDNTPCHIRKVNYLLPVLLLIGTVTCIEVLASPVRCSGKAEILEMLQELGLPRKRCSEWWNLLKTAFVDTTPFSITD